MQPEKQKKIQHADKQSLFHVGQNLDILDSVQKWMNAEVRFVGNGTIYVHYTGWSAKYDQSIPVDSDRILLQWEQGKQIKLNNRIDVYHPNGGWLQARVIELNHQEHSKVKVHFFNFHKKYDMWVNIKDNDQVAIIGSRSKAYGMGKNRKKHLNAKKLSELIKQILQQKTKKLKQSLQSRDLVIKAMGSDGNCLFRSISDQLYGTQDYHKQIRKCCIDYISHERVFFQDYILQDIDQYLQMKRVDGEWGDDIQIQALSQMYNRPIEIYVFDDKPIKTFHQSNQNEIQPMRLNYMGACHYNSIKVINSEDKGLIQGQFGQYQQLFFMTYNENHEQFQINNQRIRNRQLFSNCNRIQDTIEEQLQAEKRSDTKIQSQLDRALEISETQALLEQIQNAELKQAQNRYQQQKLNEDLKRLEQKQLQQAKKLSRNTKNQVHPNISMQKQKPYWFDQLICQGFSEQQIWFAIDAKGYDPDAVQNFLLDNF